MSERLSAVYDEYEAYGDDKPGSEPTPTHPAPEPRPGPTPTHP